MLIHYRYWIAILAFLIVILIAEKWSTSPDFTTYLSNAATLTSLLLGTVAIFYSFISNDSLSRGLGGISIVSQRVEEARKDIANYLDKTALVGQSIDSSSQSLEQARQSLSGDLVELRDLLHKVNEKSDNLSEVVGGIPPRLEKVEMGMEAVSILMSSRDSMPAETDSSFTDFPRAFLVRGGLEINRLLFVAIKVYAQSPNKSISTPDFARLALIDVQKRGAHATVMEFGMLFGFLLLLRNFGFIDFDVSKMQGTDAPGIKITKVEEIILNEADDIYISKIKGYSGSAKHHEEEANRKAINDYFR